METKTRFHSQYGQDRFIFKTFFPNKRGGVFLDVGAYDGVKLSNTFFFEKEMGWTGLCIEPSPTQFKLLSKSRSCICVNCAVYDREGDVEFLDTGALSGIIEGYDKPHRRKVWSKKRGKKRPKPGDRITVPCRVLPNLLREHNLSKIDYMSIDTEGSEPAIIKTLDMEEFEISVISVENNYDDRRVKKHLSNMGYVKVKHIKVDDIYCLRGFWRQINV